MTTEIKQSDYNAAKQALTEKYEAKLIFTAFNGTWKAGPAILAVTFGCHNLKEVVLLDEHGNPCKIKPGDLRVQAWNLWKEQMNAWYDEFTALEGKDDE